jgi:hypothetical protein
MGYGIMGLIYGAYNKITSKLYIGQTIRSMEIRKKEHISKSNGKGRKVKFHKALLQFPEKDWVWQVLKDGICNGDLTAWEIYHIVLYDSYHNGYNSNWGINKIR